MSKVLTEKEQKAYLLSKIGEPVHFTYPEPPYHFKGTLKDRCVVNDGGNASVTYWNMIDLIKFENQKEYWLRITYYRYKKKAIPPKKRIGWVFAGQTSLSDPISHFEELFTTTVKEKAWIRPLFKKIVKECAKELE